MGPIDLNTMATILEVIGIGMIVGAIVSFVIIVWHAWFR